MSVDDGKMSALFNPYYHYLMFVVILLKIMYFQTKIDTNVNTNVIEIAMCVTKVSFSYHKFMGMVIASIQYYHGP